MFAILGALLIGAISPGPSFVYIVRVSVGQSRGDGLAGALGMGVGAFAYGVLALAGLRTLMTEAAGLYLVLRIAGGLYLVWLAIRIWRGARGSVAIDGAATNRANLPRSFALGLGTQLSNPKIVAVFGAVFAALLPAQPPLWLDLAVPPLIFVQETTWYSVVALAFSSRRPRALYLRLKLWIDRIASLVIGGLGIRLVVEAL